MRTYSVISPSFWTGVTGRAIRALGPDAQVVALYLISCPSSTMIGLYYLPLPTLCHETGCSIEGASKALLSLGEIGFCHYDTESEQIWVPEMAKWQIGEQLDATDKRIKAIRRVLKHLGNSPFITAFLDRYSDAFHLTDMKGLRRGIEAPSMPLRSQKQEQEQNQKQEQEVRNVSSERFSADAKNPSKPADGPANLQKKKRRSTKTPTTQGAGEVVAAIPLADGSEAPVTDDIVAEWTKAFPGVNVIEQLGRIRVYFMTNPQKRKTASGIGRCITSWLAREQDRGRGSFGGSQIGRRDRSGAPLPPPRKTEIRDRKDGDQIIREEYDTETGQIIRSAPRNNPKGGKS
jgi:hypothetical protein